LSYVLICSIGPNSIFNFIIPNTSNDVLFAPVNLISLLEDITTDKEIRLTGANKTSLEVFGIIKLNIEFGPIEQINTYDKDSYEIHSLENLVDEPALIQEDMMEVDQQQIFIESNHQPIYNIDFVVVKNLSVPILIGYPSLSSQIQHPFKIPLGDRIL